jgi:hypothetical protein
MTDCTHGRTSGLLVSLAAICALTLAWCPAGARADGDPASDVLVSQSAFLPGDAGISRVQQLQLGGLLAAAQRSGYPIRVAVVASRADLGSVTELWRQPRGYAKFLGQELELVYRGPLLVVMPNGYGLAGAPASAQAVVNALPVPGQALGNVALTAVQRLAGSAGHSLELPRASGSTPPGSADFTAWAVFALGAVALAGAWAASIRARPLRG